MTETGRANRNGNFPALEIAGLAKSFSGQTILRDVSLRVAPGEIVVVMGPSGGGKSTLLRCMIGALRPDGGDVRVFGQAFDFGDPAQLDALRLKFGVLFQSGALFTSLTVGENVALPIRRHTELPPETIAILVKLKLNQVGLGHARDLLPSEISGGMVKRAALARALALDPRLVFCDEPSAGLDPVTVARIDKLLRDVAKTLNIGLVVVTHEMRSAFRIADRMVMLYDGRVVAEGTPDEMRKTEDPLVRQFIEGLTEGPIAEPGAGAELAQQLLEDDLE